MGRIVGASNVPSLCADSGVVRVLGGPGPRKYVACLERMYFKEYGAVLWSLDDGIREPTSLMHGIDSLRVKAVANCYLYKLQSSRPSINSLTEMVELL